MMIEYTLLTTLAFHHLVIGGILFTVLALLNKLVASSAELRSWLWMTAFIISTLVPFTLITDGNEQNLLSVAAETKLVEANADDKTAWLNNQQVTLPDASWHLPSEVVFNFSFLLTLAVALWLLGSLWRTIMVASSYLRTRQLINVTIEHAPALSQHISATVFTSTKVSSPLVVGLIKPKIIIPKSITEQLPHEQLIAIVLHEYAHIKRKDNWFGLFQELIAILFWWSPVIRVLNKHIHVEREIACDLRAVAQMKNSKQYAQSLIDCAKLMVIEQRSILAMGLFSKKKELHYRVGAILKSNVIKRPKVTLVAALCVALVATTIQATQVFSPKISIKHTIADARHYSLLPERESQLLINAVARDDIDAIRALQQSGVDINVPALGDGTALIIAVKRDNKAMVQALIDLGADVDQSSSGDGNPLITAAMSNNLELAELLIDNGADVNAIVPRDETALINASYFGYYQMTELLINRGADVNLAVTTGMSDRYQVRSPLNRARNPQIKALLVANGAAE